MCLPSLLCVVLIECWRAADDAPMLTRRPPAVDAALAQQQRQAKLPKQPNGKYKASSCVQQCAAPGAYRQRAGEEQVEGAPAWRPISQQWR